MDDFVMSLTCEEYYYYDEDWDDYDHSIRRTTTVQNTISLDDWADW